MVADPISVPFDAKNAARLPVSVTKQHKVIDFAIEQTSDTPTITKVEAASCSNIRETIRNRKILEEIAKLSQSHGDIPQSRNMKQSLKQHALSRNEDPIDTSVDSVLSFLHGMYTKGWTVWS